MATNTSNNISDDILDVIEMAIEKHTADLRKNFIQTSIKDIGSDNKTYVVGINGADYSIYSGCGIKFTVGDSVWVHIPYNDYKKAYICASATSKY